MKQTRPHLQISPLGLVNKYGSKIPKQVKNDGKINAQYESVNTALGISIHGWGHDVGWQNLIWIKVKSTLMVPIHLKVPHHVAHSYQI